MFNKISRWFGTLSGPKKVGAVIVTVATGVGAVVGAVNGSIALYETLGERSRAANPLELVDVGFTYVREKQKEACHGVPPTVYGECSLPAGGPAVDFKVANSGEDSVIIERADVRVKKLWTFKAPYGPNTKKGEQCVGAAMQPSFNYEVKLPTEGAPYTVSTNLSQSIKPSGTDRFTITPHRDERTAKSGEDYVFLVTISLIYGVENNAVTSPDLLYGEMSPDASTEFGGMPGMDYAYHGDECFEAKEGLDNREIDKLTMQNKQAVAEIRRIEAPRNETLEDLLKEVS